MEASLPRAIACYLSQASFNATDSSFPIVVTVTVGPGILSFVLALRLGQIRLSGLTGRLDSACWILEHPSVNLFFFPTPSDLRPHLRPRKPLNSNSTPTLPLPPLSFGLERRIYEEESKSGQITDRKICARQKRSDPGNCGEYFFLDRFFLNLISLPPFQYLRIAAQCCHAMRCDAIPNSDARNFSMFAWRRFQKRGTFSRFSSRLMLRLGVVIAAKKSWSSVLASTSN